MAYIVRTLMLIVVLCLGNYSWSMKVPLSVQEFFSKDNKQVVCVERFPNGLSSWGASYLMKIVDEKGNTESAVFRTSLDRHIDDFKWELYCSKAMGEAGVAPKVLFEDLDNMCFIIEFVQNATTISAHRHCPEALAQMGVTLRRIHSFVPPHDGNDRCKYKHIKILVDQRVQKFPICSIFKDVMEKMQKMESIFERAGKKCFCHNDFGHGANWLWDQKRVWAIDWEMASTYYPYYDIGGVIQLLLFSDKEREIYLNAYFDGNMTPKDEALVYIGEQYGLLRYAACSIALIQDFPTHLCSKDIDEILEWTALLTGKMTLTRAEMGTDSGRFKIAVMLTKQAELNMAEDKYKKALTLLGVEESL